jgi:hypothetical protein
MNNKLVWLLIGFAVVVVLLWGFGLLNSVSEGISSFSRSISGH